MFQGFSDALLCISNNILTDGTQYTSNNDVNEQSLGSTRDIRVSQPPVDVKRGGFQPENAFMSLSGARNRVGGDPTVKESNSRKHSAAEQIQRDVSTALDQPTLMSSVDLRPEPLLGGHV